MRHMLMVLLGAIVSASACAQDLSVLSVGEEQTPPSNMVYEYLRHSAQAGFARRATEYEQLEAMEDVAGYQTRLRDFFLDQIGGLPDKTPLNARVVDTQDHGDHTLEKVIFESQPGICVTGLLHLPKTPGPHPAVLVPCGHDINGKAAEAYQRGSILLAKNGIAAFCFDPLGQGERRQILNADGQGIHGTVVEHTFLGVGCILLGLNTARYMIHDGMRAVDYLVGRSDIDAERIGCAGNSGGGTQTSYLMALDPRVFCAAPSCYITSLRRLYDTIGPQDAEQNIHGQAAFVMEHADYIIMRAPRPTLVCSATRDFFDIEGTWDSFREAKRVYTRLGFAERVDIVETDEEHGWTPEIRVGMARWMRRWLLHSDEPVMEQDFPVLTPEEALCTSEGQVLLMEGARSFFDINSEYEARVAENRKTLWLKDDKTEALGRVRAVTGIRALDELPVPEVTEGDTVARDGYQITKLTLAPEQGIVLPALMFRPDTADSACLYLHGDGKQADAEPGGAIEAMAHQGCAVLAVDLRGVGETKSTRGSGALAEYFGKEWQESLLAYDLGKSMLSMRAEDILVCARYLTEKTGKPVRLVAVGNVGPPALHAAALEPELFSSVTIERSLWAWADVVRTRENVDQLVNAVHGALAVYDLPDLAESLPGDKLSIIDPVDATGKPTTTRH